MKVLQFAAIVMTAVMLIPTGAHFFELSNKIGLPREQYFIVQRIYLGWAYFGIPIIASIIIDLALAIMSREQGAAMWFAFGAFVLMTATLAIFFIWTYPANQATGNWSVVPDNWRQLRRQWEYSHAVNACLTFGALCSLVIAVLTTPAVRLGREAPGKGATKATNPEAA